MSKKVNEVNGFKVGDIVTGKSSYWLKHYHARIVSFDSCNNAILKQVKDLGTDDHHQWKEGHKWDIRYLILVEPKKSDNSKQIKHIINGTTTIVIVPQEDGTYKKGVAKLHPEDEFNTYEGLRIALARAYGVEPFEKEERTESQNAVNKLLWDKFINTNTVIHCKTIDAAEKFSRICNNQGIKWCSGNSMIGKTCFSSYQDKTCYMFDKSSKGISYCYINYFKSKGYEVIEFAELMHTAQELSDYSNEELLRELSRRLK